jgi:Cu/Zn superoxide dismutase
MLQRLALTAFISLLAVACGHSTASAPAASPSTTSTPSMSTSLAATKVALAPQNGSEVKGTAYITQEKGEFVVRLHVTGLKPGTSHPAHIHAGHCASNGPIIYNLQELVADKNGAADSTTVIGHIYEVPKTGWYINVHQGPTLAGPGFTPVACSPLPPH